MRSEPSAPEHPGAVTGGNGVQLAARGGHKVFLPPPQAVFHPGEEPAGWSWVPVNISEQQHFVESLGSTRPQESKRVLVCGFRAAGTHREERCVCVCPHRIKVFGSPAPSPHPVHKPLPHRGGFSGAGLGCPWPGQGGCEGDFGGVETQELEQQLMTMSRSQMAHRVPHRDAHFLSPGCPSSLP